MSGSYANARDGLEDDGRTDGGDIGGKEKDRCYMQKIISISLATDQYYQRVARAVIHNSNYQSIEELKNAVDRYFLERNHRYAKSPKRAGNMIWGRERVKPIFKDSNNCKDPRYG